MNYINKNDLKINSTLFEFINKEAIQAQILSQRNFGKILEKSFMNLLL